MMDAFETLISELLRHEGYWTVPGFHVNLQKDEKRAIGRATTPRWEIDVLAYRGATNELLVVECKSFLDSRGVLFRDGAFGRAGAKKSRFKLFEDDPLPSSKSSVLLPGDTLRDVVLRRLVKDVSDSGLCPPHVDPQLCLAVGKFADSKVEGAITAHFESYHPAWKLIGPNEIRRMIRRAADRGYTNDVAHIVAKLVKDYLPTER
jgi:hypothetical protein